MKNKSSLQGSSKSTLTEQDISQIKIGTVLVNNVTKQACIVTKLDKAGTNSTQLFYIEGNGIAAWVHWTFLLKGYKIHNVIPNHVISDLLRNRDKVAPLSKDEFNLEKIANFWLKVAAEESKKVNKINEGFFGPDSARVNYFNKDVALTMEAASLMSEALQELHVATDFDITVSINKLHDLAKKSFKQNKGFKLTKSECYDLDRKLRAVAILLQASSALCD